MTIREVSKCIKTLTDPKSKFKDMYDALHEFHEHYKEHSWAKCFETFSEDSNKCADLCAADVVEKLNLAHDDFKDIYSSGGAKYIFFYRSNLLAALNKAKENIANTMLEKYTTSKINALVNSIKNIEFDKLINRLPTDTEGIQEWKNTEFNDSEKWGSLTDTYVKNCKTLYNIFSEEKEHNIVTDDIAQTLGEAVKNQLSNKQKLYAHCNRLRTNLFLSVTNLKSIKDSLALDDGDYENLYKCLNNLHNNIDSLTMRMQRCL